MTGNAFDRLKRMAVFAEIVGSGSMTSAARRLAMSPSAVSQQLRQLEHELGLTLMLRSTRKLALTEAGQHFYAGCSAMIDAARSAEQSLAQLRDEPEGELRLAAPIGFAALIADALAPLRRQPRLTMRLLLDDAPIDLIDQRIDLALRVGEQPDSSRVARRLGTLRRQLCAAPSYLAARGVPDAPADLATHDWLGGRPGSGGPEVLDLTARDGRRETVRVDSRVAASQAAALHALCLAGWGISAGISEDDARALADGRLVPVLPGWLLPDRPVYAVMPRRGRQPAKVRHALSLLQAHFDRGLVNERIGALASPGAAMGSGQPNGPGDGTGGGRRRRQITPEVSRKPARIKST